MYNRNNPIDKDIRKRLLITGGSWFLLNYFVLPNRENTELKLKIYDSLLYGLSYISTQLIQDKLLGVKMQDRTDMWEYMHGYVVYMISQYFLKTNNRSLENTAIYAAGNGVLWYYINKNPLLSFF